MAARSGEPQMAEVSYDAIARWANDARGDDRDGYRAEFVKLVRMADSLGKVGMAGQP